MKGSHNHMETSTITDIFHDQKKVNVCERTVKMAPCDRFGRVQSEWMQDRKGGGVEEMEII
jgi:hypothetical protein